MQLNIKISAKVIGTILILGIVGMIHTTVMEPGGLLLTGSAGIMGTTLLWSE